MMIRTWYVLTAMSLSSPHTNALLSWPCMTQRTPPLGPPDVPCHTLLPPLAIALRQDREIARNLWKHHRMFPPGSRFKHYWDYVMVFLVLYNCIVTPMQVRCCAHAHAMTHVWQDHCKAYARNPNPLCCNLCAPRATTQLGYFRGPIFTASALPLIIVDVCIWLLFAADILVNFRTSFYDEDHLIVLSPRVVADRYLQGWYVCREPQHTILLNDKRVSATMPSS